MILKPEDPRQMFFTCRSDMVANDEPGRSGALNY